MKMTWPYVAGFFDGEGSIGLCSHKTYGSNPRLQIAQSGQIGIDVLTRIQVFLAEEGIATNKLYSQPPTRLSKLDVHRLIISARANVTACLTQMMPYLITKKLESQDVLRHMTLFPALPKGGRLTWESRRRNIVARQCAELLARQ